MVKQHTQGSATQQNLALFFKDMAKSPSKRKDYASEPNKIMGQYGLEQKYQTMLLEGDVESIQRALGGDGDEQPIPIIIISAYSR
jgi:hypothetical protein